MGAGTPVEDVAVPEGGNGKGTRRLHNGGKSRIMPVLLSRNIFARPAFLDIFPGPNYCSLRDGVGTGFAIRTSGQWRCGYENHDGGCL